MHVSKVNYNCSKEDINNYIKQKFDVEFTCEELPVKSNSYKSFKIGTTVTCVDTPLDSSC